MLFSFGFKKPKPKPLPPPDFGPVPGPADFDPFLCGLALRVRALMEIHVDKLPTFGSVDLQGACGYASYLLTLALNFHGYEARLAFGMFNGDLPCGHMWAFAGPVDDQDPLIVDITYTQFGRGSEYPRVFIERHSKSPEHQIKLQGQAAVDRLRRWDTDSPWHPSNVRVSNDILASLGVPETLKPYSHLDTFAQVTA